jgi:hypothetical protein
MVERVRSFVAGVKFDDGTQFFDVEGIPVTIGAGPLAAPSMYCTAWDQAPPRRFDPGNGAPISREVFLRVAGMG